MLSKKHLYEELKNQRGRKLKRYVQKYVQTYVQLEQSSLQSNEWVFR